MRRVARIAAIMVAVALLGAVAARTSQAGRPAGVSNVVLVHGGFVDGAGW